MPTPTRNLPPRLDKTAEAALARDFRRTRKTIQRVLVRAAGGLEALDPSGGLGRGFPPKGSPQGVWRTCAGSLRKHWLSSPVLCAAAERLLPVLGAGEAAALRGQVQALVGLRNALLEGSLRPLVAQARAYARKQGQGANEGLIDDLVQEGTACLLAEVERFDPSRGATLATFAGKYALPDAFREIWNAQMCGKRVSRAELQDWKACRAAVQGIQLREGRNPGLAEVAELLGWSVRRAEEATAVFHGTLSMDGLWPGGDGGAEPRPAGDHPALACQDPRPEAAAEAHGLAKALAALPGLQRQVISLHFGLGRDEPVQSTAKLAATLGLRPAVVEDALRQALATLAGALGASPHPTAPHPPDRLRGGWLDRGNPVAPDSVCPPREGSVGSASFRRIPSTPSSSRSPPCSEPSPATSSAPPTRTPTASPRTSRCSRPPAPSPTTPS